MTTWRRAGLAEEELTGSIIGAFYKVYKTLGFGFLEKIYLAALEIELRRRGHRVAREVLAVVVYDGIVIGRHRLDMVVDDKVVVEAKSTARLAESSLRQLLSYLSATEYEVGLLLHFGPEPKFYRQFSPNQSDNSGRSA